MKFKKILSLGLASLMLFSMVGCGDKKPTTTDESKVKSVSDALALTKDYQKGNFTFSIDFAGKDAESEEQYEITTVISGKTDGNSCVAGLTVDAKKPIQFDASSSFAVEQQEFKTQMDNLVSVITADNKRTLYLDLNAVINPVVEILTTAGTEIDLSDLKLGYFGLPLPMTSVNPNEKYEQLVLGLIDEAMKDVPVTHAGVAHIWKMENKDTFKSVADNAVAYLKAHKSDFKAVADEVSEEAQKFDLEGYVDDLFAFYKNDIMGIAHLIGSEITEAQIEEMKASVKEQLKETKEEIPSEEDVDIEGQIDEFIKSYEEYDWAEFDKAYEENPVSILFSIAAGRGQYSSADSAVIKFEITDPATETTIKARFEIDGADVKIEEPEYTPVGAIVDKLLGNEQIQALIGGLMGGYPEDTDIEPVPTEE